MPTRTTCSRARLTFAEVGGISACPHKDCLHKDGLGHVDVAPAGNERPWTLHRS
jgi:hypothetical protein